MKRSLGAIVLLLILPACSHSSSTQESERTKEAEPMSTSEEHLLDQPMLDEIGCVVEEVEE